MKFGFVIFQTETANLDVRTTDIGYIKPDRERRFISSCICLPVKERLSNYLVLPV